MKKYLMVLMAMVCFGIGANAQTCKDNISVEWKKDGLNGSTGFGGGYPAYVNVTNNNNFDVSVSVSVTAVSMADGENKMFSESFIIKANSNKTTAGKSAIVNTKWYRGVNEGESQIEVKSCVKN